VGTKLDCTHDEVIFAKVKVTKFTESDIFQLGFQYGGFVQYKRKNGEIDW